MSGKESLAVTIELEAKPGDTKDGRKVIAVTIDENGPRYKLDEGHNFQYVGEDKAQAEFVCSYCRVSVGFVLPGLGEPACGGVEGNRTLPADHLSYVDKLCSTS